MKENEYKKEFVPKRRERKTLVSEEPVAATTMPVGEAIGQAEEIPAEAIKMPQRGAGEFYDAFNAAVLADGLASIGEDGSFESRAKIAKANGIANYYAQPDQNQKLLALARDGKLKRA